MLNNGDLNWITNYIWGIADVVRCLLADAGTHGAGRRHLNQHSAGSGKSNSIAWLARQLIDLKKDDAPVFDSIIVVTDRRILDRQIHDTIRQFSQVSATVGHADRPDDLRRFIESGKKIIISTVQKFPFILDEIGNEQRGRRFAILIDEAHSSIPKLPAPQEEDLSKGILDAIAMDSYRVEKQAMQKIVLPDEDTEIGPLPTSGGAHRPEPEPDRLSNIIQSFNEHFG